MPTARRVSAPCYRGEVVAASLLPRIVLAFDRATQALADGIFSDDGGGLAKLSIADLELLLS